MSRAILMAMILGAFGASAAAAQASIGVSAVVLEPVEIVEVDYQVTAREGRLEVREERGPARRTMVLDRTVVEVLEAGQPQRLPMEAIDGGEDRTSLTGVILRAEDEPLVITRIIAANS